MAKPTRVPGSIQAGAALDSVSAGGDGAFAEFDASGSRARFGAKGGPAASRGVAIATLLAGALLDVLVFAANGLATFVGGITAGGVIRNDALATGFGIGGPAGVQRIQWDAAHNAYSFVGLTPANSQASVEILHALALGNLVVGGHAAAPTGSQLSLSGDAASSALTGANGAPPGQVGGYLVAYKGAQKIAIPYYLLA